METAKDIVANVIREGDALLALLTKGTIASDSLASGGKKAPAKMPDESVRKNIFVDISKANDEQQTVTGVVLQPETIDAHGDIYSAEVVRDAAYKYLANYNRRTKLGRQHKDFKNWTERFALVESYLAPVDLVIGSKTVKAGSWIMTVKVLDAKVWKAVKDGEITGFSIGGKAKVQSLK